MSENNAISVENRVVVFMDMHNFSKVVRTQEDAGTGFLREVYAERCHGRSSHAGSDDRPS